MDQPPWPMTKRLVNDEGVGQWQGGLSLTKTPAHQPPLPIDVSRVFGVSRVLWVFWVFGFLGFLGFLGLVNDKGVGP